MNTENDQPTAPVERLVMPCPFCGGTVKVEFRPGECGYSSDGLMIRCAPCGIAFHEDAEKWERGRGTVLLREEAEANLLKRWNTRHQAELEKSVNSENGMPSTPRATNCYALQHGDRVLVYDARDFINDWETPCSMLMRPATVVCRYGSVCDYGSGPVRYPDLIDVIFDHRPNEVSRGHFTDRVNVLA